MDLEDITLSGVREKQILYDLIYMWNLKSNKQNNKTNKKEIRL